MSQAFEKNLLPLQYELLTSLETLAGSQQILRHFLMKIVNALDLKHAYFLQKYNENAGTAPQTYKIPQVVSSNIIEHAALKNYHSDTSPDETSFIETIQIKKNYLYVFGLDQLGYLVLHRERKPVDTPYLNAITQPLVRFAQAYFNRNEFMLNIAQHNTTGYLSAALERKKHKLDYILGSNDHNFVLYQQSIQSMSPSRYTDHHEVLLRVQHHDDIIMPHTFIPTAERYGKICEIDIWVLNKTLNYLKNHQGQPMNANLSGITLCNAEARQKICDLIHAYPKEAPYLCLEITETTTIASSGACIGFMEQLTKLGVSFAIDDFGAGMSFFSFLQNLPIKYIKIDGSFIKNICHNELDAVIVKTITDAAKKMSIQTVAEFVRDEATLNRVSELGIDYAQGYCVDKPQELAMH
ncbi:MAG: EAL domain-containing protein [Leucothrix sp.]